MDGLIAVTQEVLSRSDKNTKIIPGHGPLSSISELQAYQSMLVTVRDAVSDLIRHGYSEEEAIAKKPTASLDRDWSGGVLDPDSFVRIIYASLSQTSGQ